MAAKRYKVEALVPHQFETFADNRIEAAQIARAVLERECGPIVVKATYNMDADDAEPMAGMDEQPTPPGCA
ncbi:hypothetical protein [Salinisphaera sp.]|uniref:hypothetical protein n=1 Tax=Salinisphaera sp. TaxID=1914330 RepID=UPI000C6A0483|nr:hypothetical protein [Salinisphaera sp.]MAS09937.1 hypothetical protein [Salinisphaera sp.]|tara:strand:- start:7788 stop:8000 length:213 start_codon:yes stop_codon:yes gene_type:complete